LEESPLTGIQARIRRRDYRFTLHAAARMIERDISVREVEEAVLSSVAEVIESYPGGRRKPSCLVFGLTGGRRPLHVQCICPPDVAIITAYEPKPEEWADWRVRK